MPDNQPYTLFPEIDLPTDKHPTKKFNDPRRGRTSRNALVQPFLKWAGGKRQLRPKIREQIPTSFNKYFEPFIGGAAVLFDLQPKKALINDANEELINCYRVIRDKPEELLKAISIHRNEEDYFYKIRAMDRSPEYQKLSDVEKAARIIFLNKTCFNGLFRVNSRGEFNAPFGFYESPTIADEFVIKSVSNYLKDNEIEITCDDFVDACANATEGDFIYFDPPYDPVSDTASFTGYNLDKFDRKEQKRLKEFADELVSRGCKVLLSNSDTDFIRNLYAEEYFIIYTVPARRNINSVGTGRGVVNELLIRNYAPRRK